MTPNKITLHCSDSPNGKPVSVEEIRRWHLARGWQDIGYHFVIDVDGAIGKGRPVTEVGAHVEGHNTGNLGICLVGKDRFTDPQFYSLMNLLRQLQKDHLIPTSQIFGHYQFDTAVKQGKTCPNMDMGQVLAWYQGVVPAIDRYRLNRSGGLSLVLHRI